MSGLKFLKLTVVIVYHVPCLWVMVVPMLPFMLVGNGLAAVVHVVLVVLLVARSVPHAFLPTYQNVYPTESMMSVLPLRFSGESESELSEQFTDWIKQFELVVRISILLG